MIRYFLVLIFTGFVSFSLDAQPEKELWEYSVESGRVLYQYTGNTEGYRELFFRDFGREKALYTNLERSSTFFAITTTTPEHVVEFLKDGKHYHFDMSSKTGQILDFPIHLLHKYFRVPDSKSYRNGLEGIGAVYIGEEEFKNHTCEKWTYRDREFWVWQGLLMKMNSSGLNKNYSMEAVEIDFVQEIPDKKFKFPNNIPLKK